MTTDFSARPQALGYLHQVRFSLLLILEQEESTLSIENFDDIVLESGNDSRDLLQLKHRKIETSLANASPDLWKTLRIWSTHLINGRIDLPGTLFSLITTAVAPENSIAYYLRDDSLRNPQKAHQMLLHVAETSANDELRTSFQVFKDLPPAARESLLSSIYIMDRSPRIEQSRALLIKTLKSSVRREHRENLLERLEGWWFDKVVSHLRGSISSITGLEVYEKVREIAEQFHPDALPIDYYGAAPQEGVHPESDKRQFVDQLRAISVGNRRIEKAILDFYRAFEQRSRWVREELLVSEEISEYEDKLVDELQRFRFALEDECDLNFASEDDLQKLGRDLLRWIEQVADIRIRPNVYEPYVMRGSYHILADAPVPRVHWHPKFLERLGTLISKMRHADA